MLAVLESTMWTFRSGIISRATLALPRVAESLEPTPT